MDVTVVQKKGKISILDVNQNEAKNDRKTKYDKYTFHGKYTQKKVLVVKEKDFIFPTLKDFMKNGCLQLKITLR